MCKGCSSEKEAMEYYLSQIMAVIDDFVGEQEKYTDHQKALKEYKKEYLWRKQWFEYYRALHNYQTGERPEYPKRSVN